MENASKALIMAAGVLIGVIILGIAVYLFTMYGQYSKEAYDKMSDAQISQFNAQFLKYYGNVSSVYIDENGKEKEKEGPILCTAHDILTVANLARQNNIQYDLLNESEAKDNTFYIRVDIGKRNTEKNLEKWDEVIQINFLKENATEIVNGETKAKSYICKEVNISPITKRVNYILFQYQKNS